MATENTKIDLDSLDEDLVQEIIDINPDVNPMDAPPPVDDGVHRVKLLPLDSTEVEVRQTNPKNGGPGQPFIGFRFTGVVQAEGTPNNNKRIFGRVNTLAFDGKSEIAQYIKCALGDTAEARAYVRGLTNYVKLAKAFRQVLAGEPIIKLKTKWAAQRKEEVNGKDVYSNVLSGQRNFPQNEDGSYRHIVFDKKTETEVAAQSTIVDILPDK